MCLYEVRSDYTENGRLGKSSESEHMHLIYRMGAMMIRTTSAHLGGLYYAAASSIRSCTCDGSKAFFNCLLNVASLFCML